jgi:hypothetical protein
MVEPDEIAIWQGVPDTEAEVNFIVDEAKGNEFTVVTDKEVAGYDVVELLYMIDGVWRVTIQDTEDEDSDSENPGLILSVILDRRYKAETVRRAVSKLLENLYLFDD